MCLLVCAIHGFRQHLKMSINCVPSHIGMLCPRTYSRAGQIVAGRLTRKSDTDTPDDAPSLAYKQVLMGNTPQRSTCE